MNYLTVSQLAKILEVTPQGINKYLREQGLQSQAVKKGNKFLIDEKLAETIRNHFRPNDPEILKTHFKTEINAETAETDTETIETETETNGNDKTAGQAAIFKAQIEQLEIRLKEKDSEIDFLRNELKDSREIQKQLAAQNTVFTTKYLVESTQEQENETDSVINIQPQEQEENTIAVEPEQIQEQETIRDNLERLTFGQRLKFVFTGRID